MVQRLRLALTGAGSSFQRHARIRRCGINAEEANWPFGTMDLFAGRRWLDNVLQQAALKLLASKAVETCVHQCETFLAKDAVAESFRAGDKICRDCHLVSPRARSEGPQEHPKEGLFYRSCVLCAKSHAPYITHWGHAPLPSRRTSRTAERLQLHQKRGSTAVHAGARFLRVVRRSSILIPGREYQTYAGRPICDRALDRRERIDPVRTNMPFLLVSSAFASASIATALPLAPGQYGTGEFPASIPTSKRTRAGQICTSWAPAASSTQAPHTTVLTIALIGARSHDKAAADRCFW